MAWRRPRVGRLVDDIRPRESAGKAERVIAAAGDQGVVAWPGLESGVTRSGNQGIVAGAAGENVIRRVAGDLVVARRADDALEQPHERERDVGVELLRRGGAGWTEGGHAQVDGDAVDHARENEIVKSLGQVLGLGQVLAERTQIVERG